jgi:hypothetical protein
LAQRDYRSPLFPLGFSKHEPIYAIKLTHPAHFDPEDGGSIYLRNTYNIAHIKKV